MDSYPHIIIDVYTGIDMILNKDRDTTKLRRIIEDYEPYLEISPMAASSIIRYLQIKLSSSQEIDELTETFIDLVRINSEDGIDYGEIIKEATRLYSSCRNSSKLKFEDYTNLVFAKGIASNSIFLTEHGRIFKEIIRDKAEFSEYKDLRICDVKEVIELMSEKEFPSAVTVRTPDGDSIRLNVYHDETGTNKSPTPVDFAYKLHTSIGHCCKEALINDKKVSLDTSLKNGQIVRIITGEHEYPSREWLEFVSTKKAKAKIEKWHVEREIDAGKKEIVKRFGNLYALNGTFYSKVAHSFNLKNISTLFHQIGLENISIEQVQQRIYQLIDNDLSKISFCHDRSIMTGFHMPVNGVEDDYVLSIASCCLPFPDNVNIVGIKSNNSIKKHLSIHKGNCSAISSVNHEKIVHLKWNSKHCTLELQLRMINSIRSLPTLIGKLNEIVGLRYKIVEFDAKDREFAHLKMFVLVNNKREMDEFCQQINNISKEIGRINFRRIYAGAERFKALV